MSTPQNGNLPALFDTEDANIANSTGTAAVLLLEPQVGAAAVDPLPKFYGGATLIDGTLSSTDTVPKDVTLWKGKILTTQSAGNTGALSTTASTVARASGSFITDGFKIGDQVMVFAPRTVLPNANVDGILAIVTGVAALTLTVNGTPFAVLALAAGTRVCRVSRAMTTTVPIGAGTTGAIPNVKMVNNGNDSSISVGDRKLGAFDLLAISALTAVSAGTIINANIQYARY